MSEKILKIGTRGSPLALRQTQMVVDALSAAHPGLQYDIVTITTSGDWKPEEGENRLSEKQGGKGLFIKEIESALMDGRIDCAVHSMKDVPSYLPDIASVHHVLPRADVRDALLSLKGQTIEALPQGAVVGTSSLRRQAFLLHRRPDLVVVPLRGNVQTRIDKLKDGQVDATFLAMAGLSRLGIQEDFIYPLSVDTMVPACGQGVVAIETRKDDNGTRLLLDAIHHEETGLCVAAERAALQTLDGSCHTPISAHARLHQGELSLIIAVGALDGAQIWQEGAVQRITTPQEASALGHALAQQLKDRLPEGALS